MNRFVKKLDATVDYSTSIPQGDGYCIRDGYTYSISKPRFLSLNWNLHISENIIIRDDLFEETTVDLLIWPYGINDYKVRFGITKTTINHDEHSIQSISTDMMFDKNMNLLDDTPENRELYEQNLDKIEHLYHLAYEMWGILELE